MKILYEKVSKEIVSLARDRGFVCLNNERGVVEIMILDWVRTIHKMNVLTVESNGKWVFRIVFLGSKLKVQHTTTDESYESSLAALLKGIVQALLFLNTPEFSLN